MSFFKKLGAVALGVGSAAGWAATAAAKAAFESTADRIGNGSITSKNGNTYTGRDYRDAAHKMESKDGLWKSGFQKTKELWNDND